MEKLNWKFIVISALTAVFISILSGLAGGVGMSSILVRALVVLVIFSVFAAAVNFVAITFLDGGAESSVSPDEGAPPREGGKVNIVLTEDDDAVVELPSEPDDEPDTPSEPGNTEIPGRGDKGLGDRSRQVDLDMATSMDIDTLPDLGSFSTSFSSADDKEEKKTESAEENGYNEVNSFSSGGRLSAQGIAGTIAEQNSTEDMAKAVKTVMNREETR